MTEDHHVDPRFAPHDSLLGRLQRGTAAGVREARHESPAHVASLAIETLRVIDWDSITWMSWREHYVAELVVACDLPLDFLRRELLDERERRERVGSNHSRIAGGWHEGELLGLCRYLASLGRLDAVELLLDEELWVESDRPWAREAILARPRRSILRTIDALHAKGQLDPEYVRASALCLELWEPDVAREWARDEPRVEAFLADRPPRRSAADERRAALQSMSWDELAGTGHSERFDRDAVVRRRTTSADTSMLIAKLAAQDPREVAMALAGLAVIPGEETFRALRAFAEAHASALVSAPTPNPLNAPPTHFDRFAIGAALEACAPKLHRPLARQWIASRSEPLRSFGWRVLHASDEPGDHEFAMQELREMRSTNVCPAGVHDALECLRTAAARDVEPDVARLVPETTNVFLRGSALETLLALDPERFDHEYALDCLGDMHPAILRLGIRRANLDDPSHRARLERLADAPFDDVMEVAQERLRSGTAPPS